MLKPSGTAWISPSLPTQPALNQGHDVCTSYLQLIWITGSSIFCRRWIVADQTAQRVVSLPDFSEINAPGPVREFSVCQQLEALLEESLTNIPLYCNFTNAAVKGCIAYRSWRFCWPGRISKTFVRGYSALLLNFLNFFAAILFRGHPIPAHLRTSALHKDSRERGTVACSRAPSFFSWLALPWGASAVHSLWPAGHHFRVSQHRQFRWPQPPLAALAPSDPVATPGRAAPRLQVCIPVAPLFHVLPTSVFGPCCSPSCLWCVTAFCLILSWPVAV